jgi:phenylalanyl-tRNA synthetase beta chain
MKLSLSWIKKKLFKKIKNSLICHQLTQIGLEVDFVKKKNNFKNAYIGKIVKIILLEKINSLFYFKIKLNKNVFVKVLSENKNCYLGMKLAVGIKKNFKLKNKLKKKKISLKGEIYNYSDFKIFGNKNNIVEFPKDEIIGQNVQKYFEKINNDIVNITIPHNRNDCLGVIGIARELSVINNCKLNFDFDDLENIKNQLLIKKYKISIFNRKICSNYFVKIVQDIDISIKTPFWIREKLRRSNIFSKDIVSDIVNYISLELGQSIHVFDFDKIKGHKIDIRLSSCKEKIQIDENLFLNIFPETVVISNQFDIFSLGGYIHSSNFLINRFTKNIYIGAAVFHESVIDKIKKKYNQYYHSYDHYYRKCEEKLCLLALEKISFMINKLCGGTIKYIGYSHINLNLNKKFFLTYKKINKLLGFFINKYTIINILKRLEYCFFEKLHLLEILPPFFRLDVLCSEDIISDIIRFYGYDKFFSFPLHVSSTFSKKNYIFQNLLKIKRFLHNNKYNEVINYSFTNKKSQNLFFHNRKIVKIINPISNDFCCMRKSLFPGLLKNLQYNFNRQVKTVRFFESGLCFVKKNEKDFKINQFLALSGIISGYKYQKSWLYKEKKFSFYDLKNDVENFLYFFYDLKKILFKHSYILGFDRNICAEIYYQNIKIGCIGMFDHTVKNYFNLSEDVFSFEIFIKKIPKNISFNIQEFFLYPHSERDFSIIISKDIPVSKILSQCYKVSCKYIFYVKVFDLYFGKNIPKDKKSLSITIFFKNNKRNFVDNEVNDLLYLCINKLKKKFNAILRDK